LLFSRGDTIPSSKGELFILHRESQWPSTSGVGWGGVGWKLQGLVYTITLNSAHLQVCTDSMETVPENPGLLIGIL